MARIQLDITEELGPIKKALRLQHQALEEVVKKMDVLQQQINNRVGEVYTNLNHLAERVEKLEGNPQPGEMMC